ncbi:hypothetical protein ABE504_27070 [Paenibacillus oryzisoli]|uniref:DUF6973 domain-containing protein n=1 Tax=Paenibacillus oryzisoli TaxID=1850517 RepID=UPI003D292D13
MKKAIMTTVLGLVLVVSPTAAFAQNSTTDDISQKQKFQVVYEKAKADYDKNHPKRKAATKTYPHAYEMLDAKYQNVILEKVMAYEKANPTASEDEVNDYFVQLEKTYNSNNKELISLNEEMNLTSESSNPFYEYIGGKAQLNDLEEGLFEAHPVDGLKALTAAQEATDWTVYKFGYNGHNDKSDAFRHSAWNIWIIGFTSDSTWAANWTNAHELGAVGQPQAEYDMDMQNNSIGRLYAFLNGIDENSSVTATRNTTVDSYTSGSLWRIVSGSNQYFTGSTSDFIN